MEDHPKRRKVQLIAPDWQFNTTAREAAMIIAALRGALREDQYEAALRLANRLTIERAEVADEFADQLNVHADKVQP